MNSGRTQARMADSPDSEQPQEPQEQSIATGSSPSPAAPGSRPFQAEPMDADCRELLRRHFEARIGSRAAAGERLQLVAAFTVLHGEVLAFAGYARQEQRAGGGAAVAFQLTERRRRIVRTYYKSGELNLLLYVNQADSEHYMPLSCITRDCAHQRRLRRRFREAEAAAAAAGCGGGGKKCKRLASV